MSTGMLNIKFVNASQDYIHWFKNLKKKLYNYNANIFFIHGVGCDWFFVRIEIYANRDVEH
jgi:hypothetical protein